MSDDTLVRFTAHELRRDDLRALMVRSNGPAMARALWHFGLLVVTGTLVWIGRATLWVIPLLIAHGYVLAFLFCAFHESAHRTAFRSRWLNVLVGSVAGFLTFWPYRNYRVFHWEHHRYTQDAARDPELFFPKPASLSAYLFVLTGIPNCLRRVGDILRLAAGRADRPWMAPRERRPLILEARASLGAYAVVVAGSVVTGTPFGAARVDPAAPHRPGVPTAVSVRGAHGVRFHPRLSRQHADDADALPRAPVRLEH